MTSEWRALLVFAALSPLSPLSPDATAAPALEGSAGTEFRVFQHEPLSGSQRRAEAALLLQPRWRWKFGEDQYSATVNPYVRLSRDERSPAGMAERGSWLPALVTGAITVVFFAFTAYYCAAAGLLPKPPLLNIGLVGIAVIYTLRGAVVIPAWVFGMKMSPFDVWSSLISLAIGLLHGAAVWQYFRRSGAPLVWSY